DRQAHHPLFITIWKNSNFCFFFPVGWQKRWTESKHKSDYSKFQLTAGSFYGKEEKDKGKLYSIQDARFYARLEPFSNEGQTLVIPFTVKHKQKIDCAGGYIKQFPYIMFGKVSEYSISVRNA
uniref:Calreticulin n=1 Tax=Chelonoidis abingdonii TaxID=106734 RepID=A0A8C0IPI4_CHEAB